ncbi:MAG: PorP/SprF family type IX secretion system membrane protein [Bacteroidia bacterium]
MKMKQIYKIFAFGLLMLGFATANAQQMAQTNLYLVNRYIMNPANAGDKDMLSGYLSHRQQWVNIEGAPRTSILSVHSPVGKNVGFGGTIISDKTDIFERLSVNLSYAYHIQFSKKIKHSLSLAVSGGFLQNKIEVSDVRMAAPGDVVISPGKFNGITFNVDAGLRYNIYGLEIGAAVPQLLESKVKYKREIQDQYYQLVRHYLFFAGYKINIAKKEWFVEPSGVYRYFPYSKSQFDANLNFHYKNIAWVGGTYRYDAGYVVSAGFKVADQISIAYAYEFGTTGIAAQSAGSHEAMIGFHLFSRKNQQQDEEIARLDESQMSILTMVDSLNHRIDSLYALQDSAGKANPEQQKAIEDAVKRIDQVEHQMKAFEGQLSDVETEVDFMKMRLDTLAVKGSYKQVTRVMDMNTGKEKIQSVPLEKGYYVVIESFRSFDNAERYIKAFNERGDKAIVVHNVDRGWYYCYLKKFDDLKTALAAMEETRKNGFEDAWVHIYKDGK